MRTPICDLLGIQYPIIQGGMAWISNANLAAAVSNAGGLGIIAAGNAPGEVVREEIRKAKEMTKNPFGVNVMLVSPHAEEVARIVAEEVVPVVTTGAGNPARYMDVWQEAGIKVMPVVASTGLAKLLKRTGVCAFIAEGTEAGGHIGEISTMALIPQVCDAVDLPVIAAGGIGDGRGIAAALMLGAQGVQLGTRFLLARECNIHPSYKERIIAAKDISTMATGRRLGHPVRSLKTTFSREFLANEYENSMTLEELEALGTGAFQLAVKEGDLKKGCFMAGQIAGLLQREQSAEEIIKELMSEAAATLKGVGKWVK